MYKDNNQNKKYKFYINRDMRKYKSKENIRCREICYYVYKNYNMIEMSLNIMLC